jgi:hypothetical protein
MWGVGDQRLIWSVMAPRLSVLRCQRAMSDDRPQGWARRGNLGTRRSPVDGGEPGEACTAAERTWAAGTVTVMPTYEDEGVVAFAGGQGAAGGESTGAPSASARKPSPNLLASG